MTMNRSNYPDLVTYSDDALREAWGSALDAELAARCCVHHAFMAAEPGPEDEAWLNVLYGEMSARGMSTKRKGESLCCEVCKRPVEVRANPAYAVDVYVVCQGCGTRRLLGDHLDCRLRHPEPLPEGW